MIPLPLLITGITGVAGYHAFLTLRDRAPGQVIGLRPHKTWRMTGPSVVALDAEDDGGLRNLFAEHRFASVLNTVGNCALKSCELAPAMAHTLNVTSAASIARCCRNYGSRLVHLSSDLVFSGKGMGGYREEDPPDPVTVYGSTMAEGERQVAAVYPSAAILRISLPMGPSFNGHAGAIDWIQSRFRPGRPATLYFDEVRSCTYVEDLTEVFVHFLSGDQRGLYHLGGPRAQTLYQIGQIVNRVGNYDSSLLKGCPRAHAGPMPPRAGNVSMRSDKLHETLGWAPFRPWPAEPVLWPLSRDWHHDRPEDEARGATAIEHRLYRVP